MKVSANENVESFDQIRSELDQQALERFDTFWEDVQVFDITDEDHCTKAGVSCPNFGKHITIDTTINM